MSKISGVFLENEVKEIAEGIKQEMRHRTYSAANELRNAAILVLRGQRSGRRYKVPGTYSRQKDRVTGKMRNGRYYTASAPGEPPAERTGIFRLAWQPNARIEDGKYTSMIENDVQADGNKGILLGDILEDGTSRMAPRPYQERILKKAEGPIKKIYEKPYLDGGST